MNRRPCFDRSNDLATIFPVAWESRESRPNHRLLDIPPAPEPRSSRSLHRPSLAGTPGYTQQPPTTGNFHCYQHRYRLQEKGLEVDLSPPSLSLNIRPSP